MREMIEPYSRGLESQSVVAALNKGCYSWKEPLPFFSNVILSFAAALALFVLVPLTRWFATPSAKELVPTKGISMVDIIPEPLYHPPIEIKEPEPQEPEPEIEFRPTFEQLEISFLPGTMTSGSIPGWTLERAELPALDSILEVGDVDEIPQAVRQIAPVYPAEMKRLGLETRVVIEFVVDERGHVTKPKILRGEYEAFNRASLNVIRKWKFEPGMKDGKAVKVRLRLPLDYRFRG